MADSDKIAVNDDGRVGIGDSGKAQPSDCSECCCPCAVDEDEVGIDITLTFVGGGTRDWLGETFTSGQTITFCGLYSQGLQARIIDIPIGSAYGQFSIQAYNAYVGTAYNRKADGIFMRGPTGTASPWRFTQQVQRYSNILSNGCYTTTANVVSHNIGTYGTKTVDDDFSIESWQESGSITASNGVTYSWSLGCNWPWPE